LTPREAGLRWPAEWEPHAATWLSWPHNRETWPGRLAAAEAAFVAMVSALHSREQVCVGARDAAHAEHIAGQLRAAGVERGCEIHLVPSDDAWVRDHGPIFLAGGSQPALVDFGFDAWGRKYVPWDQDDAVPRRIAALRGARCFRADFVLEGGSVDGDGDGTAVTTESCLLNGNRLRPGEPPRSPEQMERRLHDWLGVEHVLWLGQGIAGDDTDGHVDDVARFVAPGLVVAAHEPDPADLNHAPLAANLARLHGMCDARGRRLDVLPLPMPAPVVVHGVRCPASYANFYLANGVVLVPVFDVPQDATAVSILREALPGREVAAIPARDLVQGLGAVHCLTQQEPLAVDRREPNSVNDR